jgi:feruloyl esterase
LVSNSRACAAAFDVAALRCSAGADTGDDCLSDAQLTAVRTVLSPASFGPGSGAYHDAARPLTGNEDDPQAWPLWVTGDGDVRKSLTFAFADSAIKAFIARDPNVQSLAYPAYDQDLDTLFYFAAIADATSPDIRPFTSRGGKVIFWHGGNDGAFSVNSTADYVGKVTSVPGGETSAEASVRFYVAPGVNHCSGGPGADKSDLLAALDAWVTEDRAPGVLRATKLDAAGAVQFERPLCPYPQHPRYTGPANDPAAEKSASNYVCAAP